jgi:hypothetical protein
MCYCEYGYEALSTAHSKGGWRQKNGRSQSSVKEEERGHFSAGLLGPGIPHPLLWASTGLWAAATKQLPGCARAQGPFQLHCSSPMKDSAR